MMYSMVTLTLDIYIFIRELLTRNQPHNMHQVSSPKSATQKPKTLQERFIMIIFKGVFHKFLADLIPT